MTPDGQVPRFTHCVRCGKQRRRPKGRWAVAAWLIDRYCSRVCAEADQQRTAA